MEMHHGDVKPMYGTYVEKDIWFTIIGGRMTEFWNNALDWSTFTSA